MEIIERNVKFVKGLIARACERAGRSPDEIALVAVSKFVEAERVEQAIEAGINIIGENRVQEAEEKYRVIGKQAIWHMVGHLQTNKVKKALQIFSMVQSLDSVGLALEIERRAHALNRKVPVLVEVNTSGEPTKFGVEPTEVCNFIKQLREYKHLAVQGLMTIGPNIPDPEEARKCFRLLAELRKKAEDAVGRRFPHLSMGMSGDFEVAIEEGSNMVRIGTAIFGERDIHDEKTT